MNVNPASIKDELDKIRGALQDHKSSTYTAHDSLNKKLNDHIERTNQKIQQFSSVIDMLIKENQELKALLANQRFVIQSVNPFSGQPAVSQQQQQQQQASSSSSQNPLSLPLHESFLPSSTIPQTQNGHHQDQQQSQQASSQSQQSQQSRPQTHHSQQQQQQQQQQHQQQHQRQQQQQQAAAVAAAAAAQSGVLDGTLGDATANGNMLRFINNQYVDDEQTLASQTHPVAHGNPRIDFVFMDPSASRARHFRTNSAGFGDTNQDDDDNGDSGSPIGQLSPPQSGSRLQKSATRHSEYDAENYDLIIHNDFNQVKDIYYEYYNSLKPQVERVQKAYKIKKIRKYQKIKALAVRIDRYKELKGCSLAESFQFFDNLRIAEDNTKRSIAWLYNTLPDVLKKIGLEDQLKRNPNN